MYKQDKLSRREIGGLLTLVAGFVGGLLLSVSDVPRLSSYFVLVLAIAICVYLFIPRIRLNQQAGLADRFDLVCMGVMILSYMVGVFINYVSSPFSAWGYLFISIGSLSGAIAFGRKALRANGGLRLYYLGYVLLFAGMLASQISFMSGIGNAGLGLLLGLGFIVAGAVLLQANQQAFKQWRQERLLDKAKGEPFYGEQVKGDEVKEQR